MKKWDIIRGKRAVETIEAESLDAARAAAIAADPKNAGAKIVRVRTPVGMRGSRSTMPGDELDRRCSAAIDAMRDGAE